MKRGKIVKLRILTILFPQGFAYKRMNYVFCYYDLLHSIDFIYNTGRCYCVKKETVAFKFTVIANSFTKLSKCY